MKQLIDLRGQVFGKLIVTQHHAIRRGQHTYWQCICSCGREKWCTSNNLRTGKTVSCGSNGCRNSPAKYGSSFSKIYAQYKTHASQRNLAFELSPDQFYLLTQSCCFYCDILPNRTRKNGVSNSITYNGIDRLSNILGYTVDNTVTCCAECNYAKHTMSVVDYISLCQRVAAKHK